MQKRKHFDNPTPPKRCDARDMPESGPEIPIACRKKVFKAGMCIRHYNEWRLARIRRGQSVTRYYTGKSAETGLATYRTKDSVPAPVLNWCNVINCRRPGQIVMDKVISCMVHFQKDQLRRQRVDKQRGLSRAS